MTNLAEQYNTPNEAELDKAPLSPREELLYESHPRLRIQSYTDRQLIMLEHNPSMSEEELDRQWESLAREERQKQNIANMFFDANCDSLTGLFNRRGLDAFIELEQERVNSKLSIGGRVLYMDMSRLKYINDTYGHDAGDAAIKFFADTLREILRDTDVISRPGGDEFVVLMRDTAEEETQERIKTLQEKAKSIPFLFTTIGARVGIATYSKNTSVIDAVNFADQMQNELAKQAPASEQRATRPAP